MNPTQYEITQAQIVNEEREERIANAPLQKILDDKNSETLYDELKEKAQLFIDLTEEICILEKHKSAVEKMIIQKQTLQQKTKDNVRAIQICLADSLVIKKDYDEIVEKIRLEMNLMNKEFSKNCIEE